MKIGKLLVFCFALSFALISCEEDEGTVITQGPRANFSYSPLTPVEGDEILFSAEAGESSTEIVTWNWNFGDQDSTLASGTETSFIYESQGSYDVTLEVIDAAQNVFRITRPITITKAEFPATIAWEFTSESSVGNINDGSSAPVIGDDGTIYYVESRGGAESKVIAVRDLGESAELKWASTEVGGELPNAPSIGPDGNIFINAWLDDKAISKLNALDGSIIWSGAIGTDVSNNTPAIDSEGNSYHGSRSQGENGGVYSWSPTGEKRWEITGVGAFYSSPVISADESTVYFLNTSTGDIWAINTQDGTQKWDAPVGLGSGVHGSSLSIDADGTIYFTINTHIVAVTDNGATGEVKWQVEADDASNSGIVIGGDGTLYTGSKEGLLALNPADGALYWSYDAEIAESVPAVDVNGNIYVGTTDGKLLIVNSEGDLEKEFELGDNIANSPTIGADGTVYIEVMHESVIKLFKVLVEGSAPANSAWPMKGQNAKNTGKASM